MQHQVTELPPPFTATIPLSAGASVSLAAVASSPRFSLALSARTPLLGDVVRFGSVDQLDELIARATVLRDLLRKAGS